MKFQASGCPADRAELCGNLRVLEVVCDKHVRPGRGLGEMTAVPCATV